MAPSPALYRCRCLPRAAATVNGVITTHPGVLYQDAASPGTFKPLQDLP